MNGMQVSLHTSPSVYHHHVRRHVRPGDYVFADESQQTLQLVPALLDIGVTMLTTSVDIALLALARRTATEVVMLAGVLDPSSRSVLISDDGIDFVRRFAPRWGYFGGHGYSAELGLLEREPGLSMIKNRLASVCERSVAHLSSDQVPSFAVYSCISVAQLYEVNIINCTVPDPFEYRPAEYSLGRAIDTGQAVVPARPHPRSH